MTMKRLRRYGIYYVVLLLVLAAIGANNQQLHQQQWRMIDEKEVLLLELSELRSVHAQYFSAPAVRNWALARGMIAAPEGARRQTVLAQPAPEVVVPTPQNELIISTRW
jgi:hypothetical protein